MAVINLTQAQEIDQQADEPRQIVSPAAVMRELWDATGEGRNMSLEQLKWFASAGNEGTDMLRNLQTVLTGVGCLILEEGESGLKSGALQSPSDLANLLFMTENLIDAAVGMIEIGGDAAFKVSDKHRPQHQQESHHG